MEVIMSNRDSNGVYKVKSANNNANNRSTKDITLYKCYYNESNIFKTSWNKELKYITNNYINPYQLKLVLQKESIIFRTPVAYYSNSKMLLEKQLSK